ncbi:arsinothricin resistance N-acetyltransferase ArsN1 family B [Tunturiibacter gelidoferens]|uniref:Phosphinothricin acetyltransferase n=1 Tax=Tunturiibacter gelidiferens TaxID=3069689 RepID=A0A9X0U311_9BACT|nr:arsinothricin resistance N-acetyltransferase ArsN1 family B [Edaphobacter lichenicola]MBB5327936.1 phosphinothricin acetyltransferase [Edaphobacter lichenicola]
MIRYAKTDDAALVCEIYNHYVLGTTINFEEEPVSTAEMAQRIAETLQSLPWLVYEQDKSLRGFCYASKWKGRCAYRHSVESTVYVRNDSVERGIGSDLYCVLLDELRQRKFHTVIGGIALPNDASVMLHEKLGFEKVAQFREVGNKFDHWTDVGYWQLLL